MSNSNESNKDNSNEGSNVIELLQILALTRTLTFMDEENHYDVDVIVETLTNTLEVRRLVNKLSNKGEKNSLLERMKGHILVGSVNIQPLLDMFTKLQLELPNDEILKIEITAINPTTSDMIKVPLEVVVYQLLKSEEEVDIDVKLMLDTENNSVIEGICINKKSMSKEDRDAALRIAQEHITGDDDEDECMCGNCGTVVKSNGYSLSIVKTADESSTLEALTLGQDKLTNFLFIIQNGEQTTVRINNTAAKTVLESVLKHSERIHWLSGEDESTLEDLMVCIDTGMMMPPNEVANVNRIMLANSAEIFVHLTEDEYEGFGTLMQGLQMTLQKMDKLEIDLGIEYYEQSINEFTFETLVEDIFNSPLIENHLPNIGGNVHNIKVFVNDFLNHSKQHRETIRGVSNMPKEILKALERPMPVSDFTYALIMSHVRYAMQSISDVPSKDLNNDPYMELIDNVTVLILHFGIPTVCK